jgi:ABC-2 type transport system permease protein
MREILTIALTQLKRNLASVGLIINLLVVPIIMVIFLGSTFGGSAVTTGQVYDVNRPVHDPFADRFVALLRAEGKQQYEGKDRFVVCDLTVPAEQPAACKLANTTAVDDAAALAAQRLNDSIVNATITLPANFTDALTAAQSISITVKGKGDPTAVQAVQQQVEAVNTRLVGTALAARVVTDQLHGDTSVYNKALNTANGVWASDPVQVNEAFSTTTGTRAGSGFGQSAPGIAAMWVLTVGLLIAEIFIDERQKGTLQRLMVLPIPRWKILVGKLLAQYLLALTTFGVMLGVGAVFGMKWGDPLGVIAVTLLYTLAVTAMGLFLSTIVRTSGQANGFRQLLTLTLAPLGGAWWPLVIVPQWMRTIGQISPIYWSQDAFSKLVFYGAGIRDIMPSLLVLAGFAAMFLALGVSRFRFEQ